jgi:hypothetical protein
MTDTPQKKTSSGIPISNYSTPNIYSLPENSGTVDIDVPNLQRCIMQGGGNSCINYYVQGYDTSKNTFTITPNAPQGFQQLESTSSNTKSSNTKSSNTTSNITFIIIVLLFLILAIKY